MNKLPHKDIGVSIVIIIMCIVGKEELSLSKSVKPPSF